MYIFLFEIFDGWPISRRARVIERYRYCYYNDVKKGFRIRSTCVRFQKGVSPASVRRAISREHGDPYTVANVFRENID